MVRQEIKEILAENKEIVSELVKTSLLPELKAAVRNSVAEALEDMVEKAPGDERRQQLNEQMIQGVHGEPRSDLPNAQSPPGNPQPAMGRYLYCIAEGSERVDFSKIGIEQNEVYTIPYKDLCAVVHDCPVHPYQSQNGDTVKEWVLRHQKVVDKAWERFGTVIPIGFDTIIQGNAVGDPEENMKNWLRDDYDNLKAKIEKVRGRAEYGVQVFWDSRMMAQKGAEESPQVKKLQEEIRSKPKGAAYLYRHKLESLLKQEMERRADRYFKDFYQKVKPYADDLRVEKTKKTEDENRQMLMNLSCLLPGDQSKGLGEELEKIDSMEGFSVRYTGPWPPYSFV